MGESSSASLTDPRSLTPKAYVSATVVINYAFHEAFVSQNEKLGQQVESSMVVNVTAAGGFHVGKSLAPEIQANTVQNQTSALTTSSDDDNVITVGPTETMGRLAHSGGQVLCFQWVLH